MNLPEQWSLFVRGVAWLIPSTLAVAAMIAPRRATLASSATMLLSLLVSVGAGIAPLTLPTGATNLGVRIDAVTQVMLVLVSGLGWVIIRYSRTYLHGDPELGRYLRWLLLTLSAISVLVVTNHLLVLAITWTATSLALHQLLTFYSDRSAARLAAHKKFLVSRLADICLLAVLAIVGINVGSLELDRVDAWAGAQAQLPPTMQLAAVLLVVVVALKSAQLPFHGWLIQVMEAPTPVSALLHAGIVNIGGLVLIRLAPLMAHADAARLLLVIIGLVSGIVAALVMTTRVSVKVALAWSTCAQMGCMLVQCGLGLWHLALLHLVAHSLYKAHAFLSTGTAVDVWRLGALTGRQCKPSLARLGVLLLAAAATSAVVFALAAKTASVTSVALSWMSLAIILSLSITPLFTQPRGGIASTVLSAVRVIFVVLIYFALHEVAAKMLPAHAPTDNALGAALTVFGVVLLFAVKTTMQVRPHGRLSRALYPWLFAGFYLDERFTRLTFRVWPPRLAEPSQRLPATANHAHLEA